MQDLLTVRQSAVNRLGNYLISKPRAREVKLETAIHQAAMLIGLSSSSEQPGPTAAISSSAARERRPGFPPPSSASG
jgi:hypothetical protein